MDKHFLIYMELSSRSLHSSIKAFTPVQSQKTSHKNKQEKVIKGPFWYTTHHHSKA